MKSKIYLSVICAFAIGVNAADLGDIDVQGELIDTKVIENVSSEEVKSADLAETLYKQIPSIDMIRRSGIANDIILRGQKRDNIVITVDDSKICGACPNRMDPPTSHIVASNVESVTVTEGPYNVENFGTLSGEVKVKLKEPTKEFKGEVETTVGSFDYRKVGAKVSGGNDRVKVLVSTSYENSAQYEDGDGNTMAQQIANANTITAQGKNPEYQDRYMDMDAYTKKTAMAKVFVKVTDNQDLEASITANRSDDVLYGNSKMDASYDNSDIYNLKYTIRDISEYSKKLTFKAYNSQVTHPMSTKYRLFSDSDNTDSIEDSNNEVISKLTTDMTGFKLINETQINEDLLTVGLDYSKRNWDGIYIGYGTKTSLTGRVSIQDVDTTNNALFVKYNKDIDNLNVKVGARYNDTTISTANTTYADRDFNFVDANILTTLTTDSNTRYFLGIGRASRVPDGRELYFNSSVNVMSGTPTLDETTNTEIDLGVEKKYDNGSFKFKTFYSMLDDYVYFNKGNTKTFSKMGTPTTVAYHSFENIDAYVYGFEMSGSYDIDDNMYVDLGVAYQRGQKDEAMTSTNVNTITGETTLTNQTDTDLADITPLKINIALNYDVDDSLTTKIELIHANSWNNYDSDNGEQALDSYNVVNLKAKKEFGDSFEMTVGIDNIFDTTYAVSNTYADLILLSDGTTGDVMLLNEPGRYMYANLKYKF